jgi:hypothetical protein
MYRMKENFAPAFGFSYDDPSVMDNAEVSDTMNNNIETSEPSTQEPVSEPASQPKPAPASSSASTAAPLTRSKGVPANYERAYVYKPLLDTSQIDDELITRKTIERRINITKPVLATKEIQIIVPKKAETNCKDYQHYNDNKTFTGNLIDQVICNTQDYIKRIGNFF